MARVLVTGGAGFIGSHTVDRLIEAGCEVTILDNLHKTVHPEGKPDYLHPKARLIVGDVRNRKTLLRALNGVGYVFHFAAYQDYFPDFSTYFDVNATGTALLYELIAAHRLPVKKVIVASSQFVQGEGLYRKTDGSIFAPFQRPPENLAAGNWDWQDENGAPLPWHWTSETHACPPTAYAVSKYAQELTAIAHGLLYGIPSVALRYSIVQGARQSFFNAYSGVCRIFNLHYFLGTAPPIYEDGQQKRDFVDVRDVVAANVLVLENSAADNQVFCVGGGRAYSVLEFDRIVAREHGKNSIAPNICGAYRTGDVRNACSDITKLRSLGWEPKFDANDSVRAYTGWLQQRKDFEKILKQAEKTLHDLQVVKKIKSNA